MSDRIELRGIRVQGRHGVHPAERRDGQLFVVDATLHLDVSAAAASDDLSDTVDYAALSGRLGEIVAGEPVALIEALADRLAACCLEHAPRAHAVEVSVHKPQAELPVPVDDVVVTVARTRRSE